MQNYFAQTILRNGGFEDGVLTPWEAFGTGTVSVTSEQKNGGNFSCKISTTESTYTGIRQGNFLCYPGMPILIVFWTYSWQAGGHLELVFEWRTIEGTKFSESEHLYAYEPGGFFPKQKIVLAPDYATTFSIAFRTKKWTGNPIWYIDSVFIPAILSPRVDEDLVLLVRP